MSAPTDTGAVTRRAPRRFTCEVAGVTFAPGYPDTIHRLQAGWARHLGPEGIACVLARNPANEHDPNAIEVHVPALGQMVGHLPRHIAAWLAGLIDSGATYLAELVSVNSHPDHPDRPGITIQLSRVPSTPGS